MLLEERTTYRPFKYPWAFEAFKKHERSHWTEDEVTLTKDIEQWKMKLTPKQREFLTQIFRFFTQGDVSIASGYNRHFLPLFGGQPEVAMMMSSFSARENIHVAAYALLVDTLGLPETEYQAFLSYKAMADKHEYLHNIKTDTPVEIAKSLAIYSAFSEGMQLYSTFAMLLHFERCSLMPGMTNIVRWSLKDEAGHAESMCRLAVTFMEEYLDETQRYILRQELQDIGRKMVALEDAFIDLAFSVVGDDLNNGLMEGETPLDSEQVKRYIRHLTDYRLISLGCKPIYGIEANPLKWVDRLMTAPEHTSFFEARPTEYSKGTLEFDDGGYGD